MKRLDHSDQESQRNTWLNDFEQFCRIVDQYLRWPIQVAAILSCFSFMDSKTALTASMCVLAIGNASTIGKLIDKISSSS